MTVDHQVFDVFLSYNSVNRNTVRQIAEKLRERGFRGWFDEWSVLRGQEFQRQIEQGLSKSKAVAVFVGAEEIGPWEETEFRAALMDNLRESTVPIIPVLLPGADKIYRSLPAFLRGRAHVDFKDGPEDYEALCLLIAGIQGIPPDEALPHNTPIDFAARPIERPILSALQAQTIRTYNCIAEKFASKWFDHPPGEILDLFLEHLPKKSVILDAGCGPGHHALYLRKTGHEIVGIDLSKEMLRIAQGRVPGVEFQNMDMGHTTFPRAAFDAVWCAGSGVHVPREQFGSQLYEFRRILKPSGILGINLQVDRVSEIAEDGRFFEFYANREEIIALLTFVGYTTIAENYGETRRNTHDIDITLKWVTLYCRPTATMQV